MTKLESLLAQLAGLQCWNVGAGGCTGSSFSLAMGGVVPREQPIPNPQVSELFRNNKGEANMWVWCTWRLDSPTAPVASSDQPPDDLADALSVLKGKRVIQAVARSPAWDLDVEFTEGLILRVFCDHLPGQPSIKANWDLEVRGESVYIGLGGDITFGARCS